MTLTRILLNRKLLALLVLFSIAGELGAAERPNILFAFADDLGRYASAYADPNRPSPNDVIKRPNIDRVAREGTLFDSALVSSPSCTPSRAAIVACRHFFRNGSHSQLHHPWVQGVPDPWDTVRGFPLLLQDSGYHIGWSYKMHIREDRMGGNHRNYIAAGQQFNRFSQQVSAAQDAQTEKARLLDEVRQNFRAFFADRNNKQHFFYWFNPTNTHRAWTRGSGKKIWGINPDDLKERLPSFLPDHEIIREDFADYLGEAMAFDAAVGVLLHELTIRGELDNTIVVVSGDHGAPGFPRGKCNLYDFGTQVPLAVRWPGKVAAGRRLKTPVSLIDLGPTFLDAAGLKAAEDVDGQSMLAALSPATTMPEKLLRGYAIAGRENHADEARPGGLPFPVRAIRTGEYLYIINFAPDRWPVAQPPLSAPLIKSKSASSGRRMDIDFGPTRDFFTKFEGHPSIACEWELGFGRRPAEELYQIASDPDQIKNLSQDSAHDTIRLRLREKLLAELMKGQDPRVVGDGSAFDKRPYAPSDPQQGVIRHRATDRLPDEPSRLP